MRPVDLDRLQDEWDAYAVDQYHLRPDARDDVDEVIRRIGKLLDAAPTVSCEECQFSAVCDQLLTSDASSPSETSSIDFCSRFQSRHP